MLMYRQKVKAYREFRQRNRILNIGKGIVGHCCKLCVHHAYCPFNCGFVCDENKDCKFVGCAYFLRMKKYMYDYNQYCLLVSNRDNLDGYRIDTNMLDLYVGKPYYVLRCLNSSFRLLGSDIKAYIKDGYMYFRR